MRYTRRSTIIVVGGALAVASVGYGLGTQADGGTAVAGDEQSSAEEIRGAGPPFFHNGGQRPGFEALADELGVKTGELATELLDFHESGEGDRRDEFAASVAKALGISADKVRAAFDALHEEHEGRFAARLADALDVDADKVEAALDKLKNDTPRSPREFTEALADELGVDASDVRSALLDLRPMRGGRHRDHALPLRELASALDVTPVELRNALRDARAGAEKGREQRDQALAKFLADRFDLSADDVAKALDALPRPVRPDHGGRPGPGGPGRGPGFGLGFRGPA